MAFHLLNTGPEGFPWAIVKQHSYNFELAAMYVLVLGYFWKNGRPKFKYIIIEKEVECKKDMPIFVNRSKAMM